jgi:hypothetical protein
MSIDPTKGASGLTLSHVLIASFGSRTSGVVARMSYWIGQELSNAGLGFCVGGSRISREMWVSGFAWSRGGVLAWGCGN